MKSLEKTKRRDLSQTVRQFIDTYIEMGVFR